MTCPEDAGLQRFEQALASRAEEVYDMTLFVSGASDLSALAIGNARRLCDLYLSGRYRLSVVDVYEDPSAALVHQVIAAPTLVRNFPLPVRKLVGDLSQTAKVLSALGLSQAHLGPHDVA